MHHRSRRGPLAVAAAVLAAVSLAACGSNSTNTSSDVPAPTASGKAPTVGVVSNGSLGKILVDSQGRTLYLFQKDANGKSACTGACAAAWPPLRSAAKPTAGKGVSAAKLGTIRRSDGKPEVTYNGHPLYLYAADQQPGDANGQGINAFGGGWFVLSPAGTQITTAPSSGSSNGY
jgi:predicted lipoprotein with Yx(FWY)xxD motif